MERVFLNEKIQNKFMEMIYECGESQYFDFAISYDYTDYRLWVYSTFYGMVYEIENEKISEEAAQMAFDMVFPISKWDIKPSKILKVDGWFLDVSINYNCNVHFASSEFDFNAVRDMMEFVINKLINHS